MSANAKHLLQSHGLFSKLSGQVLWNLAEEAGAGEEQLAAFMDWCEALKLETGELMAALAPGLCLELRLDDPGPACPDCAALQGLRVPADSPEILQFIPPFGLGCRCRASLTGPCESPALRLPKPPLHKLCCERRPLSQLLVELF